VKHIAMTHAKSLENQTAERKERGKQVRKCRDIGDDSPGLSRVLQLVMGLERDLEVVCADRSAGGPDALSIACGHVVHGVLEDCPQIPHNLLTRDKGLALVHCQGLPNVLTRVVGVQSFPSKFETAVTDAGLGWEIWIETL